MIRNFSWLQSRAKYIQSQSCLLWQVFIQNYVIRRTFVWVLRSILVLYFIFCALVLFVHYAVLPKINEYKSRVEYTISQTIDRPVKIDNIRASWRRFEPSLHLDQLKIQDKNGHTALTLPKVEATFSWWSLLALDVRLSSLKIFNPDLDIRRDEKGKLYVAGMLVEEKTENPYSTMNWLLKQKEIVVLDGRIRWNDELRKAPELQLAQLNFRLQNYAHRHQLGLQGLLKSTESTPIDVRLDFKHALLAKNIGDMNNWSGDLYGKFVHINLATWKTYIDYPFEIKEGDGTLRAWVGFEGSKLTNFISDVSLKNLSTRLKPELELLNLTSVNGRIWGKEVLSSNVDLGLLGLGKRGHMVGVNNFSFATSDGLYLPPSTMSVTYIPSHGQSLESTTLTTERINLETIAQFSERLPIPLAQRKMLADLSPRGEINKFSASWTGTYPDVVSYKLKGAFSNFSLRPQAVHLVNKKNKFLKTNTAIPAIPGFENLSGEIDANEKGGGFYINSNNLLLTAPNYLTDALTFDSLKMQADWKFLNKNELLFKVSKMDFMQNKMTGSLSGVHKISYVDGKVNLLGELDLAGNISGIDIKQIPKYFPIQTPPDILSWLQGALLGGKLEDVQIKLKGDLSKFPFNSLPKDKKSSNVFQITGRIVDGGLNFVPGYFLKETKLPLWPDMEHIQGEIRFDNASLVINAEKAQSKGVNLNNAKVVINNLISDDPILEAKGNIDGDLSNFITYVNNSEVLDLISNFTENSTGKGNANLDLKLQIPLNRLDDTKVKGTLQLANSDIQLQDALPPFSKVNGRIEFSEKEFNIPKMNAQVLDGGVSLTGTKQADDTIIIKGEGVLFANALRKVYKAPNMQNILQKIKGRTRYNVSIALKKPYNEIQLSSNLQGLALDLPAPLNKTERSILPLKLVISDVASRDPNVIKDQIKINLGNNINVGYLRQKSLLKTGPWQVVRGGVGINSPAPEPDSGVSMNFNLASFNLDPWFDLIPTTSIEKADIELSKGKEAMPISESDQYFNLNSLSVYTNTLYVLNKKLEQVVVGASQHKGVWQANIDANQLSGYISWDLRSDRKNKIIARLANLTIPKTEASHVVALLEGKNRATSIPNLDIVSENFTMFNKALGRLELNASNMRGSNGQEWRIQKLMLENTDAHFLATGNWVNQDNINQTNLNYKLTIHNSGELLSRFGFKGVLNKGKGILDGEVSWAGLPFSLDMSNLNGKLRMNMEAGQFLKVEPGAAKLLGVLNLQALPRRLILDFRDVFSEGFSFDGVVADFSINRGLATTKNFKMRGVNAVVLLDGNIDLAQETQDLHVAVIPEINAGAASVVYGLAINPVIGVGTFLAQLFLSQPLAKALTYEYKITGKWQDPHITKLSTQHSIPENRKKEELK
jgi:uncharacterized protein (TIGR02099 family)